MTAPIRPIIDLCILIPCYNNSDGLIKSLQSISYKKDSFSIIIVDDGSLEPVTLEKLGPDFTDLKDVKIIRSETNQGITKALNKGLKFIYSHYTVQFIARLDCGDICSPQRFYTQIAFFEQHPDIHLTGSWCYFKNNFTGAAYRYSTPTQHKKIAREMYFRNVFIHPTVMWRAEAAGNLAYPEQYPYAEDYGLFYNMISTLNSAIINEFLVTCEINPKGISIFNRSIQLKSRLKVISFYGRNRWLYLMGALKLNVLMLLPYNYIFNAKKLLYKAT